ncbi:MAG: 1,2-phenylacetyl-CoA epoxidase subunit PaaD [Pseudomonadales bacterium]
MSQISLVTPEYASRRAVRANSDTPELWLALDSVHDPELPQVTIWDLGILVDVQRHSHSACTVVVTPTYSGCPAIDIISQDIEACLNAYGVCEVAVEVTLSPAWSTDLISPEGKVAMRNQGIAPPQEQVSCPLCCSENTQLISQFGSTACKALYRCNSCAEPFDYFKEF